MYFSNVCNQACIYCSAEYSSKWETENKKFGLEIETTDYARDFLKDKENFKRIKRNQIHLLKIRCTDLN